MGRSCSIWSSFADAASRTGFSACLLQRRLGLGEPVREERGQETAGGDRSYTFDHRKSRPGALEFAGSPTAEKDLPSMRLSPAQREQIIRIIHESVGDDATVWLYGSRTRDDRRGGDVDLLVQSSRAVDVQQQAALHARLEEEILLPIDLSFVDPRRGMTRFQRLAAARALPLEADR